MSITPGGAHRFVARTDVNMSAYAYVNVGFGSDTTITLIKYLPAGTDDPVTLADACSGSQFVQLLSDHVSSKYLLNFSLLDLGFLTKAENRFADDQYQDMNLMDENTFKVKLSPMTLTMTAALNAPRLEKEALLGWVRAYGLSLGLLPNDGSAHNREWQSTNTLPQKSYLVLVKEKHDVGEQAQKFVRLCISILAMFGKQHLENDHTYRQNDETILRKMLAKVNALKTLMTEADLDKYTNRIANEPLFKALSRTVSHPFGMSSTYALDRWGTKYRRIAQALAVRDTTVPPKVAKVGLIASILSKLLTLPLTPDIARYFRGCAAAMTTMESTVLREPAHYSELHRYYGYTDLKLLTSVQEMQIEEQLPICTAYSRAFHCSFNDKDELVFHGCAQSWTLRNYYDENTAVCDMYIKVFEKLLEKEHSLENLLARRNRRDPADGAITTTTSP
jgi:hypothetical protein